MELWLIEEVIDAVDNEFDTIRVSWHDSATVSELKNHARYETTIKVCKNK